MKLYNYTYNRKEIKETKKFQKSIDKRHCKV